VVKSIKFRDIFGVQKSRKLKDTLECIEIHSFGKEEMYEGNGCGCRGELTHKRVLRVMTLQAENVAIANEWERRLLWAME